MKAMISIEVKQNDIKTAYEILGPTNGVCSLELKSVGGNCPLAIAFNRTFGTDSTIVSAYDIVFGKPGERQRCLHTKESIAFMCNFLQRLEVQPQVFKFEGGMQCD